MTRRAWFWLVLSAALAAPTAQAAVVEQKTVLHTISPDGQTVRESVRLWVRLEEASDLDAWSPYSIYVDDHRELVHVGASATKPDGRVITVPASLQDTVGGSRGLEVERSARVHVVPFPPLPAGSLVKIEYVVEERPYFRAGVIRIGEDAPIANLRVEVRGAPSGWRSWIDGAAEELAVAETEAGLTLTATDFPAPDPGALEPTSSLYGGLLHYGWGEASTWEDVGSWFEEVAHEVPRGDDAVRALSRALVDGSADKRDRVEKLLEHVRRTVRYIAVEVGVGGFRPSPAAETLERKWGDCKGKSFLLLDLLEAAGVEAYPALIRLDEDDRVNREFPTPFRFNHLIVAVPEQEGLELSELDLAAGGYLFLDPTQERGGVQWTSPSVQGQEALVVRGAQSALVRTPVNAAAESTKLEVDLTVTAAGAASGRAALELAGSFASRLESRAAVSPVHEVEETVRGLLSRLLPGTEIARIAWSDPDPRAAGVPRFTVFADVEMERLVEGEPGRRSFRLPALGSHPSPSAVDESSSAVLRARTSSSLWSLALPEGWCPPRPADVAVENELGAFSQTIESIDGKMHVTRSASLLSNHVAAEAIAPLRELALAEHRNARRRLRLECR